MKQTSHTRTEGWGQQEPIPTVSIFGVPFSKLGMQDSVRRITAMVLSKRPHQIITANPIMVMKGLEEPDFMAVLRRAEMIVPDGAGVVWAARYAGEPVAERVAGFDLMHELLQAGEQYGWRVFLLGTTSEVVAEAAERLQRRFPGVTIVGYRDGYFGPEQDDEVVAEVRGASPDLLFVARDANTQDPWLDRYKSDLGVPVMMGVGGTFDIVAGRLKRAPKLFQKLRLEWFYRLIMQPTRYRRMLALPRFAIKVIRHKEMMTKRASPLE